MNYTKLIFALITCSALVFSCSKNEDFIEELRENLEFGLLVTQDNIQDEYGVYAARCDSADVEVLIISNNPDLLSTDWIVEDLNGGDFFFIRTRDQGIENSFVIRMVEANVDNVAVLDLYSDNSIDVINISESDNHVQGEISGTLLNSRTGGTENYAASFSCLAEIDSSLCE